MSTGNPFGLPDWAIDLGPPGGDVALDEFLHLTGDQTEKVWTQVEPAFVGDRARAFKASDLDRTKQTIGLVLANAIVASAEGSPRVHYSRGESAYRKPSNYAPAFLKPKTLRAVVDTLCGLGLLDGRVARAGPKRGQGRSTYWINSEKLAELQAEIGARLVPVRNEIAAPALILKDGKQRASYDGSQPELQALAAHVQRVNEQLRAAPLSLVEQPQVTVWPPRQRRLVRVFTNDWTSCGRFFGGGWQNMASADRNNILIDGRPTVELDFQGFMPRALYHLEGKECDGDPYEVPIIREAAEQEGVDWHTVVRPTVKVMFQRLMNQNTRRGLSQIENLPSSLSWRSAYDALTEKHKEISHHFFTQPSLRLMYVESQICSLVLERGLEDKIIVLPIHDSFIVEQQHVDWLENIMRRSYTAILGSSPVIR